MDFGVQTPEKTGYKFNEVTSLTGVKPYVLRFWESEFEQISPMVNEAGQKIYDKADLLIIKTVKKLLFEDKLSIPEAKAVLDREIEAVQTAPVPEEVEEVVELNLKEQSTELKEALEQIVETNTAIENVDSSVEFACKTSPLASRIKRQIKTRERSVSDRDVVNLVSAKKKLTKLLNTIQEIESRRNW